MIVWVSLYQSGCVMQGECVCSWEKERAYLSVCVCERERERRKKVYNQFNYYAYRSTLLNKNEHNQREMALGKNVLLARLGNAGSLYVAYLCIIFYKICPRGETKKKIVLFSFF